MNKAKKVLVGMSGGVDSAAAALLLLQQGYEVEGATFRLWDSGREDDPRDAAAVCKTLSIPHHIFDFREIFRAEVMEDFARQYENGMTPNPCVVCNRTVKFGAFLQKAREMGCDYVSTGHYAFIVYDDAKGRFRVRRAAHLQKDQSYVLYSLTQEQLRSIVLPLGSYDKPQVRALAEENRLIVSKKSESQDICFIPDGNYAGFLREFLRKEPLPGHFIDESGNILGSHKGIWHYTVGQRKGLGLSFPQPMFVSKIDSGNNTVTLAENGALFSSVLTARDVNWIDFESPPPSIRLDVKIRYGADPEPATVTPLADGYARVEFDRPQRAITKGQSAVFYDKDFVAGGGVIC